MPGNDFRKRGFTGSVRSHDGMDFTGWYFKSNAFENLSAVFESCVEVINLEAHVLEKI